MLFTFQEDPNRPLRLVSAVIDKDVSGESCQRYAIGTIRILIFKIIRILKLVRLSLRNIEAKQ